jgi:Mn-dependent DtxR family transcriptional regulator
VTAIQLPFPPSSLSGHAKGHWRWTAEADEILRSLHGSMSITEAAEVMGVSRGSVRARVTRLALRKRNDNWSASENQALREAYAGDKKRGELRLDDLARQMGRSKTSICKKARELGLTDIARMGLRKPKADKRKFKTEEERSRARSERLLRRHQERPHPMLGKKHSSEVREKISKKSRAAWASKTETERAGWTDRMLKSRLASQGTLAPHRPHASWKAGWREIGGKRNYYRSRWEANYARYLEWLKQRGEIKDWEHAPETFWFEAIKRGVRSYLPDFRVWENDGTSCLHEVKGWMDARSKTTLKRMAKYHPQERITVIQERAYNEIARKVGPMIEGWESGGRAGRP